MAFLKAGFSLTVSARALIRGNLGVLDPGAQQPQHQAKCRMPFSTMTTGIG
jgi:hypothetical protein